MIQLDFANISLRLRTQEGRRQVFDPVRRKWYVLTPEEHVRQYLLQYLMQVAAYPAALIAVERLVEVGSLSRRFDIVVFNREHKPWMLIECKRPDVPIDASTLQQLLAYHSSLPCPYWMLTNGHTTLCASAADVYNIEWLNALPEMKG